MGLTPALLREVSQHQIALLRDAIDALGFSSDVLARADLPIDQLAGFLARRSSRAPEIQRGLAQRGIATDVRGQILRLGPAPYLSDVQLREAVVKLGEVVRGL